MQGEQGPRFDVLGTTRAVVDQAAHVRIDRGRVEEAAARLAREGAVPPPWNRRYHYSGDPDSTAQYVLILDTLNFCFWGEPRWRVAYNGEVLDGYWALAAALTRAIREGTAPLLDARYLARMPREDLEEVLRGEGVIPLLNARWRNLREVGRILADDYGGRFVHVIEEAGGSAVALAALLAARFPSFRDVAVYRGREVHFLKRAQICASDLYGTFEGRGYGAFHDAGRLTAFADYKLPQILREWGILVYDEALAARVDARLPIDAGSEEEVEIRACTVWAVETLRDALADRGVSLTAAELDWVLWERSQGMQARPYHRTRTIFY
ncbi:MAG TPA: queuosine salvage family protein [Dehalococcoidia bacterium]